MHETKGKSFFEEDQDSIELAKTEETEEDKKFNALKCNYSFYLFPKKSSIRLLCWSLITSDYFEGIIISLICLASLKLAIETYFLINPIDTATEVFYYADLFFTISFSLEFLFKAISYGFVFDEGSYLRDSWCQLDFFIVVASIIDISIPQVNIPMIKVLRLLRIFRPLRFVTHNVNMRIIVTALFRSFGALCNTLLMVLVIWLMFSIVGVSFFAGKFQYCSQGAYTYLTPDVCIANGGVWLTYDHNFDNSINGMIYLFELTTQENWPNTFLYATDCTDVGQVPLNN